MFKSILNLIEKYDTLILHRHYRPDGDAMGSQIGLKHLLLKNYPHKKVFAVGDDVREVLEQLVPRRLIAMRWPSFWTAAARI